MPQQVLNFDLSKVPVGTKIYEKQGDIIIEAHSFRWVSLPFLVIILLWVAGASTGAYIAIISGKWEAILGGLVFWGTSLFLLRFMLRFAHEKLTFRIESSMVHVRFNGDAEDKAPEHFSFLHVQGFGVKHGLIYTKILAHTSAKGLVVAHTPKRQGLFIAQTFQRALQHYHEGTAFTSTDYSQHLTN